MEQHIVAIEGLVHAGKTTLVNKLSNLSGVFCVAEYIEFANDGFPDFPQCEEDAFNARKYFLELEDKRKKLLSGKDGIVIIDRSVLSILAYHFAVEMITCGKIACFSNSSRVIFDEPWIFPELCIYLDINNSEIDRRHLSETALYKSVFLNPKFNNHLRRFYDEFVPQLFPLLKVVKINACKSQKDVFLKASNLLTNTDS